MIKKVVNYNFLRNMSSALLHEAIGKTGNLPSEIKPLEREMVLWGSAYPVLLENGSNYMLHRAIENARDGDVIIVQVNESNTFGYWGEIMTRAAIYKKIRGLIINGCVRDSNRIIELGFPVFARGICIKGTSKIKEVGQHGSSIKIADITIHRWDALYGDADGVVVIPAETAKVVSKMALELQKKEKQIVKEILTGKSTVELLKLDKE